MFNQHAKWLKVCRDIPWRRPIASLNYLWSSHVWRQDHNGFSHQDPGFIDHVVNKKADIVRVYLPPDANTLLSWPITACAARIMSTSLSRENSRNLTGCPWKKRYGIARPV
jgi:phosphoketolase